MGGRSPVLWWDEQMTRLFAWLASYALALAAAAALFDGIRFRGPRNGIEELQEKIVPLLLVALILGLITSFVKPIVKLLSFPLIILTLGLFLVVINAVLLLATGAIAKEVGIAFRVDGFWTAVGGAIVISLVTWLVDRTLSDAE